MSDLLSAKDLRQMRADVEAYTLPDTGHILSVSETPDGQGGVTLTWGTATANIQYRLDAVANLNTTSTGNEFPAGGAVNDFSRWILTLPYDATVTVENRFKASDDTVYDVVFVDTSQSWNASRRCVVELT